jgi:hypothetical protein
MPRRAIAGKGRGHRAMAASGRGRTTFAGTVLGSNEASAASSKIACPVTTRWPSLMKTAAAQIVFTNFFGWTAIVSDDYHPIWLIR